jgi:tetratricopeptide (TPR) repeat protein
MKKHLFPAASLALPLVFLASGCGSSVPQEEESAQPVPASSVAAGPEESSTSSGVTAAPASSAQEPGQGDLVQQAAKAKALKDQMTDVLVEDRLANARLAYADGRMEDAANQLQLALNLDPTNREVRAALTDVQVAMGIAVNPSDNSPVVQLKARLAALQADAEANAERGERLLSEGDYEAAVTTLQLAKATIEGTPYKIEWGELPTRVDANLKKALADREMAGINFRAQQRAETFNALQRDESARQTATQARLDLMLQEAIEAYSTEDFDQAISLTEDILRSNPLDARASELRDASVRTQHKLVSERFVTDRQERFRLWLEELEESKIPLNAIYTGPDQDHWDKISRLRTQYANFDVASTSDPLNAALALEIAATKIPGLQLDGETDLTAVIDQLKNYSDVPFIVHQAATDAVDNESIEFNLTLGSEITVLNALELITQAAGDEVVYTIDSGVVHITTKENAYGAVVTKPHDIVDMTIQYTDFAGPRIDQIWLPDTEANEDEEGSIYGGPFGDPRTLVNPDEIADLVMKTVAPDTWEDNTAEYANGYLIVTNTPEVQKQVDEFLQGLRRYNSSMVSIEARFLTIQKDFMKEVGLDFRGLGGFPDANDLVNLDDVTSGLEDNASASLDNNGSGLPLGADTNPSAGLFFDEAGRWSARARTENITSKYGTERMSALGGLTMQFAFLDDAQTSLILRAVEKSNRAQELNSTVVMAQNTQRAFMTVLNQVTYIQDMDVEVAQAASVADPVIGVVSDGIVIDVRPIISHNRKYITLELQPTVATLLRPIPEFTSSLSGLTTPVTLQLPELFIASAKTNAIVPDGGTVVIAGLRKLLNVEQRAEIPFLAKIPILSVLFKTEGEAYENEDIIVLIRAEIVDSAEIIDELDRRNN